MKNRFFELKKYTIIYNYCPPGSLSFGFQNQLTIEATNEDQAREKAKNEIATVYGSGQLKRFRLTVKPLN